MEKKSSTVTTIVSVVIVALLILIIVLVTHGRSPNATQQPGDDQPYVPAEQTSEVPGSGDAFDAINAETSSDAGITSSDSDTRMQDANAALGM